MDERLKRYRPAGPSPELRARILEARAEPRAWLWAAAALIFCLAGAHMLTSRLVQRQLDPVAGVQVSEGREVFVRQMLEETADAERLAALVLFDEQLMRRLPPVGEAATVAGEPR